MKKNLTLIIVAIIFQTSCNISQSYHFNKDFSGSAETAIEMGELITFMNSMDTSGNSNSLDTLDRTFAIVADELKTAGAKNVKYGWKNEKSTLFIKYDFDNIESLNKLMEASDKQSIMALTGGDTNSNVKFTLKGKSKLIYNAPEISNDTLKDNEQMAAMKDYIKFNINFSFEKEIKKIDNERAIINADKKGFKFSGNIMDLLEQGFTSDYTIKFKR